MTTKKESEKSDIKVEKIKETEKVETEKPAETEKARLLREAGGLESNVGLDSPYWKLPW